MTAPGIVVSLYAGKKLSDAERRKREKQKQAAESELLTKVPKLSTLLSGSVCKAQSPQASATSHVTVEEREGEQTTTHEGFLQQDDEQNIQSDSEQLTEAEPLTLVEWVGFDWGRRLPGKVCLRAHPT